MPDTIQIHLGEAEPPLSEVVAMAQKGLVVIVDAQGNRVRVIPEPKRTPVFGLGKSDFPSLGSDAFAPMSDEESEVWHG